MKSLLAHLAAGTLVVGAAFPAYAADTDPSDPIGHFRIARYEVEGNTVLTASEIDGLLGRYAGDQRTFGDVQQAIEALESAYRSRGYSVVQVLLPEQELNQGVVHLKVIQAKLGKIIVSGNRFFSEDNIRRSLPSLREGESPNIPKMSDNLRTANQNPAKHTNVQLKSAEQDGTVDALVTVDDDKPWRIASNIDNTGNDSTGKTRVSLIYQNANLSGHDDVASVQYTTSAENPNQVNVYGLGYHLPLYASGDSIDLYGSYSNVDSGTVAAGIFNLQVSGKGRVYGGRYNWLLGHTNNYDAHVTFGIDYKAFENDVQLLGTQLGNDITVHPLSLTYGATWIPATTTSTSYSVSLVHNLPGGEHGSNSDFALSRSGAEASYDLLRYNAYLAYNLPQDWQFRGNLNGQWTRDALVAGEQFGVGGAVSVRGFEERQLAGDSGNTLNAEVYTPNLCGAGVVQCRALVFYDTARLSRNRPLPAELSSASVSSSGLGLRLNASKYLTLQTDYAYVLDGFGTTKRGDKRLHFLVILSY